MLLFAVFPLCRLPTQRPSTLHYGDRIVTQRAKVIAIAHQDHQDMYTG